MGNNNKSKNDQAILGEREIIEIIARQLEVMPNQPVPFGDDVAAVNLNEKRAAILKTDMLVGKTDVPPGMSLWQSARKALVMNISDFASKGTQPIAAMVALGLPRGFKRKDIEEIGQGLNSGAREYGAYVVGGDTGEASDLTIAISLYGTAERKQLMLRKCAKPGDILATTGYFGKSAAGLRLLLSKCLVQPNLRETFLNAVYMPQAKLKEGLALAKSKAVSASIDSSDGLAWSLHELAKASKVGFMLSTIPIADEVKTFAEANQIDPLELAFYGGEEYELVLTIKPKMWILAQAAVEALDCHLIPIGKATKEKEILLKKNDKETPIEPRGWEHFKSKI